MDCGSKAYVKQSPALDPVQNPRQVIGTLCATSGQCWLVRELLYSKQMAVQHDRQREMPSRSFVRGPGSLQVLCCSAPCELLLLL